MSDQNQPDAVQPQPPEADPAIGSDDHGESTAPSGNIPFDPQAILNTALKVITNPIKFYREMPTTGGYIDPLIFLTAMFLVSTVIGFVLDLIGLANFNAVAGGGIGFLQMIVLPLVVALFSFVGAAILFVVWKIMGSERNYETAYRCLAYSTAILPIISVLSVVPYVAGIVRTLWGIFLMYTASLEVHKIKLQTAKIVFGILAVIGVISSISSERLVRKSINWQHYYQQQLGSEYRSGTIGSALEQLENVDELTPEEAGKQMGEFLKGMEEFSKGLEESVKENEKTASD